MKAAELVWPLSTAQKPRMRILRMGFYWGDQLLEECALFELRPGPDSPLTIDTTFTSRSAKWTYVTWREQVECWAVKLVGMVDAPQAAG